MSGRGTCDQLVRLHIPRDGGSRSDHAEGAQFRSADNRRIRADRSSVGNFRGRNCPIGIECSGDQIVGERGRWTYKDVVADRDSLEDRNVVLNLAPVTHYSAEIYVNIFSNNTLTTDPCSAAHMRVMPKLRPHPDGGAGLNDGRLVNEKARVFHLAHPHSLP